MYINVNIFFRKIKQLSTIPVIIICSITFPFTGQQQSIEDAPILKS